VNLGVFFDKFFNKYRIGGFDMQQLLNKIDNIGLQLGEVSGFAVKVELLMRLIAEKHKPIQDELELIMNKKEEPRKRKNYWNCDLYYLVPAITSVFSDTIEQSDLNKLETFRVLRNKLLHVSFVELIEKLGFEAEGRHIVTAKERRIIMKIEEKEEEEKKTKFSKGGRNILKESEVGEVILSLERSRVLEKVRIEIAEVFGILKRISQGLNINHN